MKKFLSITLTVLMLLSCLSAMAISADAADGAVITLGDKSYEAAVGDTLTYTANLKTVNKIVNGEFYLNYPDSVLKVESCSLPNISTNSVTNDINGTVCINFTDTQGYDFTSSKVLAEVKFTVEAAGSGEITLEKEAMGSIDSSYIICDEIEKAEIVETITVTAGENPTETVDTTPVDTDDTTPSEDTSDSSEDTTAAPTEPSDTTPADTTDTTPAVTDPSDTTPADTEPVVTQPSEGPAEPIYGNRPVISDVVNEEFTEYDPYPVDTYRYFFYMPDSWKNKFNDNYDGISLDTCCPGIYWWDGSFKPENHKGDNEQGWPGYRMLNRDESDPHIFYADVPADVRKIILNNTVDGGSDATQEIYNYTAQTMNISTSYETVGDDPYAFYENGLENADNMIFIINPADTEINDYSGVKQYMGEWFYYYGDGKYGVTPEIGDEYFSNGDFLSTLDISDTALTLMLNGDNEAEIYCNMPAADVSVESEDDSIVTVGEVTDVEDSGIYMSKVTVTGVGIGEVFVVFNYTDPESGKPAFRKCAVTVAGVPETDPSDTTPVDTDDTTPAVTDPSDTTPVDSSDTTPVVTDPSDTTPSDATTAPTDGTTAPTQGTQPTQPTQGTTAPLTQAPATVAPTTVAPTAATSAVTAKSANTMTVKAKKVTVKAGKKVTVKKSKAFKIKNAIGKVTFKKVKGNKKITVSVAGKLTIKKGLKKGTYTVKIKITAAGNDAFEKVTKTVTVKIKVK